MPNKISLLSLIILIFLLLIQFVSLFGGLDFTDTFWHINIAAYYFDKKSFINTEVDEFIFNWQKDRNYIYNFEKRINFHFASSLITFYFFNYFETIVISRIIPFLSFLFLFFISFKDCILNKIRNKLILFVALVSFLPPIISFDYFTVLLVTLFVLFTVNYESQKKIIYLFLIFIILNLSFFIRFQNFLLIFASFFYLYKLKINYHILIIMHLFPLLFFITMIFGIDFFSITHKIKNTEHSFSNLFQNYFKDIPLFLGSIFSSFFIIYFFHKSNTYGKFLISNIIVLFLIYFFGTDYNWDYSIIITSFIISIIISNILVNRDNLVLYITLIFTMFIFPVGSATGLFKLSYGLSLSGIIHENLLRDFKRLFIYILTLSLPFTSFYKLSYGYEDVGIIYANSSYNDSRLFGIRSFSIRTDFVDQIQKNISKLKSDGYHILIGGRTSHLFTYLNSTIPLTVEFYQQDLDPNLLKELIQAFPDKKFAYFHFDDYPEFHTANLSPFEASVESVGFKYNNNGCYDFLSFGD